MDSLLVFVQNKPFLGAQVVQIPFFHALRGRYPGTRIVAVTPEGGARVVRELGYVDEVVSYPRNGNVGEWGRLRTRLRGLRAGPAYQHRRHSLRAALLARAATAGPVHGFRNGVARFFQTGSVPFDKDRYIALNYLALLGADLAGFRAAFPPLRPAHILLVPGGSQARKRYPLAAYAAVGRALRDRWPVHVLLGPDVAPVEAAFRREEGDFVFHIAPPLAHVSTLVRQAALVLANDCGPSHFAHLHGVPRVSLFDRGTNTREWFLPETNARLLESPHSGGLDALDPGRVEAAAIRLLEAAPRDPDAPGPGDSSPNPSSRAGT